MQVPFFKQDTDYTCGPTSLQMVLSFFGSFKSEAELARAARTNKDTGTAHQDMISVACGEGFFCYVNDNSSLEEVRRFVAQGKPVIVNFVEPSTEDSHYAVVTGFFSGGIVLNDPWNGEAFVLKEDNFVSRWHDGQNDHKRWMMVLSKENLGLGRQYSPTGA